MSEYYTKDCEDKFVQELKSRKNTMRSLQNSTLTIVKSKSITKSINGNKDAQHMVKQRFDNHLQTVKESIHNLEKQCSKFGGLQFIKNQMDRNEMDKSEYLNYCMSRISKNFQLPAIKQRSQSERALRPLQEDKKQKMRYNKWYIEPTERFSKSKEATKYEWNKEAFIFNIIKKKNQIIEDKFLPDFIAKSKEKINRQPLFCKYTVIKKAF